MMNGTMRIKKNRTYQVNLFLGSINEETKEPFFKRDLYWEIGKFQDSQKGWVPVRVTATTFVCGTHYIETGWEITVINYPRVSSGTKKIDDFIKGLAIHLLETFKQDRITTTSPNKTIMYERNES